MPATGLSHYNIKAPLRQLKELRDFYCRVVGLVDGERPPFASFGYWLYAGNVPILHMVEAPEGRSAAAGAAAMIDHAAFACTGFDEMKKRLDAEAIEYRLAEVPERNQRQLFFKDPEGNGVELIFPAVPE